MTVEHVETVSPSATLMHLWLLARPGVELASRQLGDALGLSVNTVERARRELVAGNFVEVARAHGAPYRYDAVRGGRFRGWKARRVQLPEDVRAHGAAAGAVYLYLAGKPDVTRAQLGEALSIHYQSVTRVLEGLEPHLATTGKNPIQYRLGPEKGHNHEGD